MINQIEIQLKPRSRGYYIITDEIIHSLGVLPESGLLQVFILHTSAGITINENADSSVLKDFESFFNMLIPENLPFVSHRFKGADDMPAHIKASLVGSHISLPIRSGSLVLGT